MGITITQDGTGISGSSTEKKRRGITITQDETGLSGSSAPEPVTPAHYSGSFPERPSHYSGSFPETPNVGMSSEQLQRSAYIAEDLRTAAQRELAAQGAALAADPSRMYGTGIADAQAAAQNANMRAFQVGSVAYPTLASRWRQEEAEKYGDLRKNKDYAEKSVGNAEIAGRTATSPTKEGRAYTRVYSLSAEELSDPRVSSGAGNYFYLWNTQGAKAAQAYYDDYLSSAINERQTAVTLAKAEEFAGESPAAASAASVVTNIGGGAGIVDLALQNISKRLTGSIKPIDYNTPWQLPSRITETVREDVAKQIEKAAPNAVVAGVNLASFLYQTGMSMADSGVAILLNKVGIPEAATLSILGGSAGTATIRDAKERGATDGQALALGISSAIAEGLFEKVSLDRILQPSSAANIRQVLLNIGLQSFTEGSEEFFTTLANTVSDRIIMGDKNQINARTLELMAQGVRQEEAKRAAALEWVKGLVFDFLGGAISGGVMGGGKEVGSSVVRTQQDMRTARMLTDLQNAQETALQAAVAKAQQGTLSGQDARAVMADPQAMQTLRDSGVLTEQLRSGSEGRTQVNRAVLRLAEQNAQNVQAPAQTPAQTPVQTPVQQNAQNTAQNTQEIRQNTQERLTIPAVNGTLTAKEASNNEIETEGFQARAERAAEGARRSYLDRIERGSGVGRLLSDLRNYRIVRGAESRTGEAARVRNEAEAGNQREVSAQDFGIKGGTADKTARALDSATASRVLGRSWDRAVSEYARQGVTLTAISGQLHTESGSAIRAYVSGDGKHITVQVDHPKLTWNQLLDHEELHRRIKADPEYRKAVENALLSDKKLQAYLPQIVERYAQAYNEVSPGMSSEDIIEELLADYRAGFDMLDPLGVNPVTARAAKRAAKDIKGVEKTLKQRVEEQRPVSVDDEVKASTEFDTDYMRAAIAFNQTSKHVPDSLMNDVAKVRETIKAKLEEIRDEARLPADVTGNTYFGNGSYNGSEENTTECPRSLSADALADAVGEALGRPLTIEETVYVAQQAFHFTDVPQCLYCYVAMDRMAKRQLLGEYINKRTQVLTDIQSGMSREEALDAFKKRETSGGKQWSKNKLARFNLWVDDFESGKQTLKLSDLSSEAQVEKSLANPELRAEAEDALRYAQNASWAKKRVGFTAYNNHILKWDQKRVDALNSMFGLRMYSFSDFSPAFILENMQMVTDAAVRGLKMLAYTKELDFVRIFAGTDMNINISVFGMDGGNGTVHMDAMQGADWKEAQELRKKHPNVGITFVATNDNQVNWALDQDWIDVVIPFHMVKTGATVAEILGYHNYTAESSDKKIAGEKAKQKEIFPSQHQNNKEKYLAALEKAHLTPRFERWLDHPNYMKLVNETRRSAEDTPAVQPKFDQDAVKAALKSLDDMVKRGGYGVPIGGTLENLADIAMEMSDDIRKGIAHDLAEYGRKKNKAVGQQEGKASTEPIVRNHNGPDYLGTRSYRAVSRGENPMSEAGYAMFADDPTTISGGSYGGDYYSVDHASLVDINELKPVIAREWDRAVRDGSVPAALEYLEGKSGKEIADMFDPEDITDSADAWDTPELTTWAGDSGIFDDIPGVKTSDGAVVLDASLIRPVDDFETEGKASTEMDTEAADDEKTLRELRSRISQLQENLDMAKVNGATAAEERSWRNELIKAQHREEQLVAKERRLSKKTSVNELLSNLDRYRRSDLESLAEQVSDSAWDDYEELSDNELRDALREILEERADSLNELERQAPKYGFSVRFDPKSRDIRFSLEIVDPIQPVSEKWQRGATYDEVKAAHPTLFELAADEAETRNPTQINGTVKTYRKIYDMLKQEGFDGTILDASSGLGYGTRAGRDEYGYDVDDIEPFPDKSYSPKYTDYSKLKKTYDVVISNAVLNVIPQDLRDSMVVKIGEMLNPGGRAFINVRGTDVKNAKSKVAINEDQMEYFIADSGSYQKGFRQAELVGYLKDALGEGFTVTPNSSFGGVSAVVTKKGGSASIEVDPEVMARFSPEAIAVRRAERGRATGSGPKISKVRSNTYENSGLYNAVEAQMREADPENFSYDPISEKKSMGEALRRLDNDFDGEVIKLSEPGRQWGGSDLDTAMGILHRYRTEGRATGDYGDFWRWSKVIQEKGTKGGQFIQAFAKYTRTGTGAAAKGAKDLQERNKLTPKQQREADNAKKKVMDNAENDINDAAEETVKNARKPMFGQRSEDAERLIREIFDIFNIRQRDHGAPVENWLDLTGKQLARKIAGRFGESKQRTRTTMQTILSDLMGFAEEHALPDRKKAEGTKRTAIDIITDYLSNRNAYGTAWNAAQDYLRAAYATDREKLDALNEFLTATISYNAEGTDRTMLDAILQSADILGISEKRILDLASTGATESTIERIGDELVSQVKERMGADYDESFTQQLKDAVRRHIVGIALQESEVEQKLRLGGMTKDAAKDLNINLQKLLVQSKGDKKRAAYNVANYLTRELDIPAGDAAIAAGRITDAFMDELATRADRRLQQMFKEKGAKKSQSDKFMDLIRLGGLTNSNVEDAVVDALGLGEMSRERQREIVGAMARFGEILDAMADDDLDGLRDLIRQQAAVRKTPLSRMSEKVLAGETDARYLREFALAQLASIAGDYEARSVGAKVSTAQTLSHLLNARTTLRNLTSNQVFDLLDSAANNVALVPDMVIGALTGKRTVGVNKSWLSEMKRRGAVEGGGRSALEVNLDVSTTDRQKSKYGTAGRRTNSMAASGAFGKLLSHLEEVMGYELNTTDEFHKGSVRGETLESLARLVERGDITQEQANAWAEEEALYRSFQDDTLVGNIMGEIKRVANLVGFGDSGKKSSYGRPIHDFGLGDLVIKYTQVPGALIHRGIEYSPLGYAKALYDLALSKKSLVKMSKQGEDVAAAQRKLALDIGRATTGTGLITLFTLLAKAGLLRRDDDDKDPNAKAAHAAQGLSGTQLNVTALGRWIEGESTSPEDGDVLADIGFLEPLDTLMTIATLLSQDDEITAAAVGIKSLDGIWKAISNTSAMQTVSNIIQTVQYRDKENDLPLYFQIPIEIASDSVSGFVPSPVRQLAQATDTTYRDQYRSHNVNQQIRDKVMNSIPGLRLTLAPKITPLGEDKKYQKPFLNVLNATLNPGNISVYQASGVVDELNRVYDETEDKNIWPERNAPYSFSVGGNSYTLTPDERTQYQRTRGKATANAMGAVIKTEWYKAMAAADQAEALNWIGNFSNFVAKKEMLEARGESYNSGTYDKYYDSWQGGTPIEGIVAEKFSTAVNAAKETARADAIIATAKIPEASRQEAESMSSEARRFYASFIQNGVSDETARTLATNLEASEATGHEQWRQIYDAAGTDGEKAVTAVMTQGMQRNWNLAKDAGVKMEDYIKIRESFNDLNGNGKQTQDEWNATLDAYTFSSDKAKDLKIKGTLWQILTGSSSTRNNPYDKDAGQKVIDAKGGGGGSGAYAPVRIPTLKLPEPTKSGLRIR